MVRFVSPMWQSVPPDVGTRLERCLDGAMARADDPVILFFRADDVAVPSRRYDAMTGIFRAHRMPLNLAVVPAWLTPVRWQALRRPDRAAPELLCWHQHGWRHHNHQPPSGKKQEFGDLRPRQAIRRDLTRGRDRLRRLMGKDFCPVFTPPWNRCSRNALDLLEALSFAAVSRSRGSRPVPPSGLLDISVNVDLHTLREPDAGRGWRLLLSDIEAGILSGRCGVMIHHQFMNRAAIEFLDVLLNAVARHRRIRPVTFRDLI